MTKKKRERKERARESVRQAKMDPTRRREPEQEAPLSSPLFRTPGRWSGHV